jgi:hypothetical protein
MARKGSLAAAVRRYEREARRRQRELEKQRKQLEKMQELQRATYEVQVYENHIDLLLSVHKECSDTWDWEAIQSSEPPIKPTKSQVHEELAKARLDAFKPGISDKLRGRVKSKREKLVEDVERARLLDEQEYREALQVYQQDVAIREIAGRMLAGDLEAYRDAIKPIKRVWLK